MFEIFIGNGSLKITREGDVGTWKLEFKIFHDDRIK